MKKTFYELTLVYYFLTGKCILPPKYPGWAQGPHCRRLMPSLPGNIHGKLPGLEFSPSKYSSSEEKIEEVSDMEFTVRNVVDCARKYNLFEKVLSDVLSSVADPGFSPVGCANSQNCYYFSIFC